MTRMMGQLDELPGHWRPRKVQQKHLIMSQTSDLQVYTAASVTRGHGQHVWELQNVKMQEEEVCRGGMVTGETFVELKNQEKHVRNEDERSLSITSRFRAELQKE
ncbi:unnamed protein product [Lampetra planeri]